MIRTILIPLVATSLVVLTGTPADAQNTMPSPPSAQAEQTPLDLRAQQVVALINGEIEPEEIFTEEFLAAVPRAQLDALSQQLISQFGAAIGVEELPATGANRSALAIRLERAIARGGIAIDPADDNRISELLFQTFEPVGDTPEKIQQDLAALPGEVSYYFGPVSGTDPVLAQAVDAQMALGSTFKLYVLATLAREIAEGRRSWDDVHPLDTRSYPSGMMQDWPQGAAVTLHTLASMMISISDNTATDQLITILGQDAILQTMVDSGHRAPALNDPLMTTRELFELKGGDPALIAAYRTGNAGERQDILNQVTANPPTRDQIFAAFSHGPNAIDIEWFGSGADLGKLFAFMRETGDQTAFEIMAINPSMPDNLREHWAYAGYKGGSEPGVLNLTWLLSDNAGEDHLLFLSWSNPDASLDEDALELIAQRILSLPR